MGKLTSGNLLFVMKKKRTDISETRMVADLTLGRRQ